MTRRSWTLLMVTGLLLAWCLPVFAANVPGDDPTRVLRTTALRGAFLELTVLDTKGRPVSGAKVNAVGSDLSQVTAVTGPDGKATLDGLPENSTGTVGATKNLRAVNWDIRLQHGKDNHLTVKYDTLCYGVNPRKYTTPLVVKLFTEQPRYEQRWAPVSYIGGTYPVKGDKFLDDSWQQLTYHPSGKGQITQAYFRPWGVYEGAAAKPMSTWWHISVYTLVNCDKPVAATPAAQ